MDDLISREWLKIAIHNFYYELKHIPKEEDIQAYIDAAPSAQPVIRCKDCLMHGVCRFEQGLGLDGYCSQAERRTDG